MNIRFIHEQHKDDEKEDEKKNNNKTKPRKIERCYEF